MKKDRLRRRSTRRRIESRERRAAYGAMSSRSSRNWSNVNLTGSTRPILRYERSGLLRPRPTVKVAA